MESLTHTEIADFGYMERVGLDRVERGTSSAGDEVRKSKEGIRRGHGLEDLVTNVADD